jgi:hypothetical protein
MAAGAVGVLAAAVISATAAAEPPYEPNDTFVGGGYPDDPGAWVPTGPATTAGTTNPIPDAAGSRNSPGQGCYDETLGTDWVKLTDAGIDFGDGTWVPGVNAPLGFASVQWLIDCGYYRPRVDGTLHLHGVAGQYGRIHVSYWSGGERVDFSHSATLYAPDSRHYQSPVLLAWPSVEPIQVTKVRVCTETSDDGADFDIVSCAERYL